MDVSEEYVKMCDNKYIQGESEREYSYGDYYVHKRIDGRGLQVGCFINIERESLKSNDGHIFLPRQDQLQEIMGGTACDLIDSIYEFLCWVNPSKSRINRKYSMEQLWLAFVMKEKFGKTWDGEQWVS